MPKRAPETHPDPLAPGRVADAAAAVLVALAVLASWFAVDPASLDSFDPPKAILGASAVGLAAAFALGARVRRNGFSRPRFSPAAALLAAGVAGTALSSLSSPRRAASIAALRVALLFLLAIPLGASEGYRRHRPRLVALFGGAAAASGLLVLLAAARVFSPFALAGNSDRAALGALVGNAGYAGIALALAAVTLLPALARPGRGRLFAIAAILLSVGGVVATRSLSAVAVLLGGGALYGALAGGRAGRRVLAAAAAALVAAVLLYPPTRARFTGAFQAVRHGSWNEAFTARAAPWLAAAEMIRAHPLAGVGIGNFGVEYVPARIAAETRHRRRLVLPGMATNSFSQAHNDYLDLLAGAGIPAGACVIAAAAILLAGIVRRGRHDLEAAASAAILGGGAVAAFAWFPLQIVPTAIWILLEAGRAGRRLAERT